MRKLIVCNSMSLDGYFEGPGKNVMVMALDQAFDAYCAERLRAADALLLGRTSFDGFRGFWPSVADDPNFTPSQREISRRDNEIDKVVVSDSLTPEQTDLGVAAPASSAARTPTSRSPSSSVEPVGRSWSSAATRSGPTCSPTTWSTSST